MLPPEVNAELAQLLQALQSADNNVRSQAEEHLQSNWSNARPEVLLMGLAEQISASTDASVCRNTQRTPLLVFLTGHTHRKSDQLLFPDALVRSCHIPPNRF